MSPQYEYKPGNVSATIETYPAEGNVEFVVKGAKAFIKADGTNFGVRFTLQMPAKNNKLAILSCYLHNEGSESMTKRFQMACIGGYGKGKAEEQRFNAEHNDDDWRLDFESGEVGEGWKQLIGSRVVGDITMSMNKNTQEEQNNFQNWRPLSQVTA